LAVTTSARGNRLPDRRHSLEPRVPYRRHGRAGRTWNIDHGRQAAVHRRPGRESDCIRSRHRQDPVALQDAVATQQWPDDLHAQGPAVPGRRRRRYAVLLCATARRKGRSVNIDDDAMSAADYSTNAADALAAEAHCLTKPISISRRAFVEAAVAPIATLALARLSSASELRGETRPLLGPGPFLGPQASSLLRSGRPGADAVADPESEVDSARTVALGTETGMGIVETSLTPVIQPAPASGSGRTGSRPVWDAYDLLEKCRQLGGSGIQAELNGDLKKLRARAEQLGMWIEGMVSVPRN